MKPASLYRRGLGLALATTALAWGQGGEAATPTLRGLFADDFLIGVAMGSAQVDGGKPPAGALAAAQFSAVTPENAMKWQPLHPEPGRYRFAAADAYVAFASRHRMALIGHALVWHSQTPAWVFQGAEGRPATREELLQRMREHIHTVVGHYRGQVKGWDVVNEALSDGGADILRDSPWRRIMGDDFLESAFRFAHEADPAAELYYNDYGLEGERKRNNCVQLLRRLRERGVPITGVGTQSHFQLEYPSLGDVEQTITALAQVGLKVMITELDIDVLPSRGQAGVADLNRRESGDAASNPYAGGLPDGLQQKLATRYASLMGVYRRHRQSISRVTLWGLDDGQSWLNDFPIAGRTNHPLLFDRALQPKPAFFAVLRSKER